MDAQVRPDGGPEQPDPATLTALWDPIEDPPLVGATSVPAPPDDPAELPPLEDA